MEHPFITDLSSLTLEQLGSKISDLYKKLAFAQRTGNGYLCEQLRMAIESYQAENQKRMAELYSSKKGDADFGTKIDIS